MRGMTASIPTGETCYRERRDSMLTRERSKHPTSGWGTSSQEGLKQLWQPTRANPPCLLMLNQEEALQDPTDMLGSLDFIFFVCCTYLSLEMYSVFSGLFQTRLLVFVNVPAAERLLISIGSRFKVFLLSPRGNLLYSQHLLQTLIQKWQKIISF